MGATAATMVASGSGSIDEIKSAVATTTPAPAEEPTPTATPEDSAPAGPSFSFSPRVVENCGQTCRVVEVTVTNTGEVTAEDVKLVANIRADRSLIWNGHERIGTLAPGESHTTARRVEVGSIDGMRVGAAGGYVTVEVIVQYAGGEKTYTRRVDVSNY